MVNLKLLKNENATIIHTIAIQGTKTTPSQMLVKTATLDADPMKSTKSTSTLNNNHNKLHYQPPTIHQPTPNTTTKIHTLVI